MVFLEFSQESDGDNSFLSELKATLKDMCGEYSFMTCTNLTDIKSVQKTFLFYNEHIDTVKHLYPARQFFSDSDMQFAAECRRIIEKNDQETQYYHDLLSLVSAKEEGEELVNTLTTYLLDADRSAKKTGEILFIHRNTVQYRMNKVKHLMRLGHDLSKMPEAYILYKTAALGRLLKSERKDGV